LILNESHLSEYHAVAFGDWNKKSREENLKDWKRIILEKDQSLKDIVKDIK